MRCAPSRRKLSRAVQLSARAVRANGVGGPYTSYERCEAAPSCRLFSRAVQMSKRAERTSSVISLTPLASVARQRPRVGGYHVLCRCQRVQGGPAASAGLTPLACDATQRHCVGCHHALCKGQQHQLGLRLVRAVRRHAIAPDGVICGAAVSVGKDASSTSRPYSSYLRGNAMPSSRAWSPTV